MVGAHPSYKTEHTIRALFLIKDRRVGRKKLVKELGIGEGSVRTLLKKLKNQGLVSSVKQGHTLTEKGLSQVNTLLNKFTQPEKFESYDLACGSPKMMTVVHETSWKIKKGVNQRDTAVKAGADGALILVYKNNEISFPSDEQGLEELSETGKKLNGIDLREGDVIVVAFAGDESSAENGVLAIAAELVDLPANLKVD